jgi:hypothetical protein
MNKFYYYVFFVFYCFNSNSVITHSCNEDDWLEISKLIHEKLQVWNQEIRTLDLFEEMEFKIFLKNMKSIIKKYQYASEANTEIKKFFKNSSSLISRFDNIENNLVIKIIMESNYSIEAKENFITHFQSYLKYFNKTLKKSPSIRKIIKD